MKSDFDLETRVRSRRKWATSVRYQDAHNYPHEKREASRGQRQISTKRTVLAHDHFKYSSWGNPSQFLEGSRDQDEELFAEIVRFLEQMAGVASGQIQVNVETGWVTLAGQLEQTSQRAKIISAVRHMRGVDGLIDELSTNTTALPDASYLKPG